MSFLRGSREPLNGIDRVSPSRIGRRGVDPWEMPFWSPPTPIRTALRTGLLLASCLAWICTPGLKAQDEADAAALRLEVVADNLAVGGQVLVSFESDLSADDRWALIDGLQLGFAAELPYGWSLLRDPLDRPLNLLLDLLSGRPGVAAAQPDAVLLPVGTPSDPLWPQQWGPLKVGAAAAWDSEGGGPATVIAVLDSGADMDHADLQAAIAWGSDPYGNDDDPTDVHGHGSHCSGIVAARAGNGVGMAGAAGSCRLAIYRCGNSAFPTSDLLLAIDDAVARGARVLSLSWGSSWPNPALKTALLEAVDAGCVVVAAAGNDGVNAPFYPAAWPEILGVASSDPFDQRSAFSNFGSWVHLAAPGQSILSCWKTGGYATLSGTSMACPLVAGAAGLLYARLGGERSSEHAAQVRAALLDSSVSVGSWVSHGRLDMAGAVALLDELSPPPAVNLTVAPQVAEGDLLTLELAGPPAHQSALLLSVLPDTLSLAGQPLLAAPTVLLLGPLPASGRLLLEAQAPSGSAGLTLWMQFVTKATGQPPQSTQPLSLSFVP